MLYIMISYIQIIHAHTQISFFISNDLKQTEQNRSATTVQFGKQGDLLYCLHVPVNYFSQIAYFILSNISKLRLKHLSFTELYYSVGFIMKYGCKRTFINFTYHTIKSPCTKLNYYNQDHNAISRSARKPKVKFHSSASKSVC